MDENRDWFIGVSQIIVEWDDYQDERFCELAFATSNYGQSLDQVKFSISFFWNSHLSVIPAQNFQADLCAEFNKLSIIIGRNFRNLLDYDWPILNFMLILTLVINVARLKTFSDLHHFFQIKRWISKIASLRSKFSIFIEYWYLPIFEHSRIIFSLGFLSSFHLLIFPLRDLPLRDYPLEVFFCLGL